MTIDEQMLARARAEGARLAEAERQALVTRAAYHTSVRRLHLAGASLREVAQALGLSHQRVQQIVSGAGGSWWQRMWRGRTAGPDAVCTFCGRPPAEVAKLIAGPKVYICDSCVASAEQARASGANDHISRARSPASRCSFCGKLKSAARAILAARAAKICGDCLVVCRQILDDRAA